MILQMYFIDAERPHESSAGKGKGKGKSSKVHCAIIGDGICGGYIELATLWLCQNSYGKWP